MSPAIDQVQAVRMAPPNHRRITTLFAGETKRRRLTVYLRLAIMLGVVLALTPSAASANSYLVKYCDRNQGTGLSSWQLIGWTNLVVENNCGWAAHAQQTGPLWSGDGTLAADGRHGGFAWQLNRPGLRIYRYNVTTEGRTGDGYVSFQHCAAGGASCPLTSSQQVASGTKTIDIYPPAGSDKRIEFRGVCWTANPCGANYPDPGGENFDGYFYNLHMWIQDDSAPSVSSTFSSGGWVRGNISIPTTGSDVGGGVQGTRAYFDNDLGKMTSSAASCPRSGDGSYTDAEPCPLNYNPTLTYNTAGNLADGYHDGCVQSYDANNTPLYSGCHSISFKVDNTAPARPTAIQTAQSPNGNGWLNNRSISLNWTNSGESVEALTQSGIDRIYYDVNPAAGTTGQTNPAATSFVPAANFNGLDVTLPQNGVWDVDVWTTDRAGNTSPIGTISGVRVDDLQPDKPLLQANGWVNREELDAGYSQVWAAPTNAFAIKSKICGYSFELNQDQAQMPDATIDVPVADPNNEQLRDRRITLPANLSSGTHLSHARAISCAGNASLEVNTTQVPVDVDAPTLNVSGGPSSEWATEPVSLVGTGADTVSGMAPAALSDQADRGASTQVAINGGIAIEQRGDTAAATLSHDGVHAVEFKTYDVARNATTQTVNVKIDRTAPAGGFEKPDPSNPRNVEAELSDATSGLRNGAIQIKPVSGGDWSGLPTSLQDGKLRAAIPDTSLPRGAYQLRIVASDVAGNQLATSRMKDGSSESFVVTTPLRKLPGLTGGIDSYKLVHLKANLKKCKRKRTSKQRKICIRHQRIRARRGKKVPVFTTQVTVKNNQNAVVRGTLTDNAGRPIPNARVGVYETPKDDTEALTGATVTDSAGNFRWEAKPGATRSIRLFYDGSDLLEPAEAKVSVKTRGKITFKLSKKKLKSGRPLTFKGYLYGCGPDTVKQGKIVQIQFYRFDKKRWQDGPKTLKANAKGYYSFKYAFSKVAKPTRVLFRVSVPTEEGYGCESSVSQQRAVIVFPKK